MESKSKKLWYCVGNKAKGQNSTRVFQENKARWIFRKTNIFYSLIRTCTFCLITNDWFFIKWSGKYFYVCTPFSGLFKVIFKYSWRENQFKLDNPSTENLTVIPTRYGNSYSAIHCNNKISHCYSLGIFS